MINSQDIKKGTCIRMDGKLYFCIDFLHRKPGKGNTIMNVTLKDVVNGGVIEKRFNIGERLEDVRVERRPYQYLYKDGDDLVFMNNETYEQITIAPDQVNGVKFLKESENVDLDRARPEGRHSHQHPEARSRRDRCRDSRAPLHRGRRDSRSGQPRRQLPRPREVREERLLLITQQLRAPALGCFFCSDAPE